jgi:hypothetical protein
MQRWMLLSLLLALAVPAGEAQAVRSTGTACIRDRLRLCGSPTAKCDLWKDEERRSPECRAYLKRKAANEACQADIARLCADRSTCRLRERMAELSPECREQQELIIRMMQIRPQKDPTLP